MEESIVITRVEKANSYEFGKAGQRFKLYFDTAEDLTKQVNALREAGFPVNQNIVTGKQIGRAHV